VRRQPFRVVVMVVRLSAESERYDLAVVGAGSSGWRSRASSCSAARPVVRGMVYPVPDPALPLPGVHVTPTIGGQVLPGPTAMLAGARDAYASGLCTQATWSAR